MLYGAALTDRPTSYTQTRLPAQTEQLQNQSNDALRGLTAKENMDMMRIIRDYAKGKLAEPLARTRLAAYGIDSDTITEILTT